MKYLLLIIITVFAFQLQAQTPVLPYYWNQPLTYNPSLAGSLGGDNLFLSLTDINFDSYATSFTHFVSPESIQDRIIDNYQRAYYFSLVLSKPIYNNKIRLSYGLELQKLKAQSLLMEPNALGLFTNVHFSLLKNKPNRLLLSTGIKYKHLIRKSNFQILQHQFDFEIATNQYTLNELSELLSSNGFEQGFSLSLQYHVSERTLIKLGISLSVLSHKLLEDRETQFSGVFDYHLIESKESFGHINISVQHAFNDIISIEANALIGYNTIYGLGINLRTDTNAIIQLAYNFENTFTAPPKNTIALSFQNKRFSYTLAFSIPKKNTAAIQSGVKTILHVGAGYRLNGNKKPSLLRLH